MRKEFALTGRRIVTPAAVISGYLRVSRGRIQEVSPGPPPAGLKVIDLGDNLVVPGYIDQHIHGVGGWDTSTTESVLNMARILAQHGVTAFYPTPATTELPVFLAQLGAVREAAALQKRLAQPGAAILGLHLEGPFLNPAKKGAMPQEYLLKPSLELLDKFEARAPGLIKRITLAPELPGGIEFIAELKKRSYAVAGGHTTASAAEMAKAIDAGITIANHLYNAMNGLHHREPGALGAYLTDDRVACELIADGIHVHPLAIEVALRCKGPDKLFLISDAFMAAGLPPGQYEFLSRRVRVDEQGVSRQEDGTIASSTFLMSVGYKTIAETLGHGPIVASLLASTTPARVAGVSDRKGALAAGKDADIAVLDENYQVICCCVEGVWHKTPGDLPGAGCAQWKGDDMS